MAIKKILVVDDSPTEALFLSEILGKNGFKVTVAADSDQAMGKAIGPRGSSRIQGHRLDLP